MKKRSLLLGMVFLFSTSAFAEMNPKSECRQILDSAQKSQREAQSNYDKANSNFSVQEREYNSSCTQNAKKPIDKAFCEGKNAKYISAKDALNSTQVFPTYPIATIRLKIVTPVGSVNGSLAST